MIAADFRATMERAGIDLAQFPNVSRGLAVAETRLFDAREALSEFGATANGYAVLAFGSLGRREFTSGSDLDLALVYDCALLTDPTPVWARIPEILKAAGFSVPGKTFGDPYEIGELTTNVGGDLEKNRSLTYRVLLLTEGEWLVAPVFARALYDRMIGVYRDAETTRGRYLTSLSNDLHRYYRTLCVDYRHKIEEQGKEWGIRYIKLRHSRKVWHLGNVCLECAAFLESMKRREGDGLHDGYLSEHLGDSPLHKIATTLEILGRTRLMGPVLRAYDKFLGSLDDPQIRRELEKVSFEEQAKSLVVRDLKENADDLNRATIAVVRALLEAECGDHLIRYGVL